MRVLTKQFMLKPPLPLFTGLHRSAFACRFVHCSALECVSAEQPIVDIDSVSSAVLYTLLTIQKAYSIFQYAMCLNISVASIILLCNSLTAQLSQLCFFLSF